MTDDERREDEHRQTRERLDWIRSQACCAPGDRHAFPCLGQVCTHHDTQDRGLSRKSPDDRAMPLCCGCHDAFHTLSGRFKGWTRDQLRVWQTAMVKKYQALWAEHCRRIRGGSGLVVDPLAF